jgi:hypothetical protein
MLLELSSKKLRFLLDELYLTELEELKKVLTEELDL